ncbi:MAG: cysteine desulfurase family protein, partial [Verrucomicrobiota bacterium]
MNGYFDSNATTPMFPEVRKHFAEKSAAIWHNPSSLYPEAAEAKRELEECREWLADFLGVEEPSRVVFTSGATESNNIVFSSTQALNPQGKRVAISAIEHPSVIEPAKRHWRSSVEMIPVDPEGRVDLSALKTILESREISLVSVMAANNETGVLQPWEEIREICGLEGVSFHSDATQWFGKLPVGELGSSEWLTGSAHKFGGPKGVGFLLVPDGCDDLTGAQTGGPQERKLRGGTENVPAISAMIYALKQLEAQPPDHDAKARERDQFEAQLLTEISEIRVVGKSVERLWNTSMIIVPKHNNLKWLTRLADLGFQVSTGSACSSGRGNPSHVMESMGLSFREMGRVLRISGSWDTSAEDWEGLAA